MLQAVSPVEGLPAVSAQTPAAMSKLKAASLAGVTSKV
jgi:hypothetical protein